MNKKNILVVDDEEKIVDVIKSYLESDNYNVIVAYNGKDAIKMYDMHNPSLVILDLMLPDITGEEVCRIIRQKNRTPIIMLTGKVLEEDVLNGLGMGADDYITKPFSPRELMARVKTVLRRSENEIIPLSDNICIGDLVIDNVAHEIRKGGASVNLTNIEYNLLSSLAKVPQKTFTREEIIEIVFNGVFEGFDRSIDAHIKNIRKKISKDIIKTIHGVGYRFGGDNGEIKY
jgi:DNA-binding response OmpR family regulator